MPVSQNIRSLKAMIPDEVSLIAVSKKKSVEMILEAYHCGQRDFGENYIQELVSKAEMLPKDIRWHFIGHLQSNKVKSIAGFVYLIHGVDSLKLLREINKQAAANNRVIDCLLQVHIATEETKFGFSGGEIFELLNDSLLELFTNIRITGLMGMATFTGNEAQIRGEFRFLKELFDVFKSRTFEIQNPIFRPKILSMGMSGDYKIAIEEGSNMLRIGSAIFGTRT